MKAVQLESMVAFGWERDDAATFVALSAASRPIARALCAREPCYAASTYAICRQLYTYGRAQETMPPMLYCHLQGPAGLAEDDDGWLQLLKPDSTGFQGLTSRGLVTGTDIAENFTTDGFAIRLRDGIRIFYDTKDPSPYTPMDSPVVGFESVPETVCDDGRVSVHEAVMTAKNSGTFPPNTLFRLKRVVPKEEGFVHEATGVRVMQQLLVVRATYLPPPDDDLAAYNLPASRFATPTLQYASRAAYIQGLSDVSDAPILTMAQEFDRSLTWTDWHGKSYSLREEWAYCNAPASRCEGLSAGVRDADNDGLTPADFRSRANEHVRSRRNDGLGLWLADEHAFLSIEETLSVRLYSGPAFQPINTFLRQIATLSGEYREAILRHAELTFCATVTHLVSAIRKLAAVSTEEEARGPLYRGVRGELPRGFWMEDEHGAVSATDTAFMSTSRNSSTPIAYLGDGGMPNVLWVLKPSLESEEGYHCGADISLLSQFAHEDECLFPPFTMLTVLRPDQMGRRESRSRASPSDADPLAAAPAGAPARQPSEAAKRLDALRSAAIRAERLSVNCSKGDKTWMQIEVSPTFV